MRELKRWRDEGLTKLPREREEQGKEDERVEKRERRGSFLCDLDECDSQVAARARIKSYRKIKNHRRREGGVSSLDLTDDHSSSCLQTTFRSPASTLQLT